MNFLKLAVSSVLMTSVIFVDIASSNGVKDDQLMKFDYRDVSKIAKENYTWQCPYVISDDYYHSKLPTDSPLVDFFEVDESRLYMKADNRLLKLELSSSKNNLYRYNNGDVKVDLAIKKKFNFSEYDESHDRNVDITIYFHGKKQYVKAVGLSCGI